MKKNKHIKKKSRSLFICKRVPYRYKNENERKLLRKK